jgi:hypothetical protein
LHITRVGLQQILPLTLAVQCSAVQCSAVQCSAVQCSASGQSPRSLGARVSRGGSSASMAWGLGVILHRLHQQLSTTLHCLHCLHLHLHCTFTALHYTALHLHCTFTTPAPSPSPSLHLHCTALHLHFQTRPSPQPCLARPPDRGLAEPG